MRTTGRGPDDPITSDDLAKYYAAFPNLKQETRDWLNQYEGWPYRFAGITSYAELPEWFQLELHLAHILGKKLTDTLTQADINTLEQKLPAGEWQTVLGPVVGHRIDEMAVIVGGNIWTQFINVTLPITKVFDPAHINPSSFNLENFIGPLGAFLAHPIESLVFFGGVICLVVGGGKVLSSGT